MDSMINTEQYLKLWDIKINKKQRPQFIFSQILKNSRVLELGCSAGYMSKILKEEYGVSVIGVELDPIAAESAKKYCEEVIVGDLENKLVLDKILVYNNLDCILMVDLLEHLKDPYSLLITLTQVLNSKGRIIILIPNIAFWRIRYMLLKGQFKYDNYGIMDKTHLKFFTFNSIHELVKQAGYKVILHKGENWDFPFQSKLSKIPILSHLYKHVIRDILFRMPNIFAKSTLLVAIQNK